MLDLTGVDPDIVGTEEIRLELDEIYIPLETDRPNRDSDGRGDRSRNLTALDFVSEFRHCVLLGDPGGGKTTFAKMLALSMALALLGDTASGLDRMNPSKIGGWTRPAPIPIHIVLRDFSVRADAALDPFERIWSYIVQSLPGPIRTELADPLRRHLLDAGGLIILDGYDEAPEANGHRQRVKESIDALRTAFGRASILVTSRIYAYQRSEKSDWILPNFSLATIAALTAAQQELFVDGWYRYTGRKRPSVSAEEIAGRASQLKATIKARPDLRPLAERPLLLTLMAGLHASEHGTLPEGREGLYDRAVELLLRRWQRPKFMTDDRGQPRLLDASAAEFLRVPPDRITRSLERLAYECHRDQGASDREADIPLARLVACFIECTGTDAHHTKVVEYVRDRAGMLLDVGGDIHRFPHRTFQEYLAARHLCNDTGLLVDSLKEDLERWREVYLLAGARLAKVSLQAAWDLIATTLESCTGDHLSRWRRESLCGQLLVESKLFERVERDGHRTRLTDVRRRLTAILEQGRLDPIERTIAGEWLAIIGDERRGVGVDNATGLPDIWWIKVEPKKGAQVYWISKYPITVAQFAAYIEATGATAKSTPGFDHANKPRVEVAFHEATAFCDWLSQRRGERISLPTAEQWEWAATNSAEQLYPWQGGWQPGRANTIDSGVHRTSPVGMYPDDSSWCGVKDMAGNVWEWCNTTLGYSVVFRGGAWNSRAAQAQCRYRDSYQPYWRSLDLGFRVCIPPLSLEPRAGSENDWGHPGSVWKSETRANTEPRELTTDQDKTAPRSK